MTDPTAATRVAIEFLTLWMETGADARQNAAEHIVRTVDGPDGPGVHTAIAGLLNLSMLLLLELAKAQGAEGRADMKWQAGEILRVLSPRLPEFPTPQ